MPVSSSVYDKNLHDSSKSPSRGLISKRLRLISSVLYCAIHPSRHAFVRRFESNGAVHIFPQPSKTSFSISFLFLALSIQPSTLSHPTASSISFRNPPNTQSSFYFPALSIWPSPFLIQRRCASMFRTLQFFSQVFHPYFPALSIELSPFLIQRRRASVFRLIQILCPVFDP